MENQLNIHKSKHYRYSDEIKTRLLNKLYEYIDSTDMPYIQRFCLDNNVSHDTMWRWGKIDNDDENINIVNWSDAIKKLHKKQELYLFDKGLHNKVNVAMALFALKQPIYGWRDDYQQAQGSNKDKITISIEGQSAGDLVAAIQDRMRSVKSTNIDKKKRIRSKT